MSRTLAAILFALALVLPSCGGGGDEGSDGSSSPTSSTPATATGAPQGSAQSKPKQKAKPKPSQSSPKQQGGDSTAPSQRHLRATVRVPPISSAPTEGSSKPAPGVKTTKGGDNSVQSYGTEQSQAERTEAAIALQAYLNARLEEDWGKVCSYLAKRASEQLERFIQSPKGKEEGLSGCPAAMAAIGGEGTPPSQAREQSTIVEVLSFRGGGEVPGDPAYLIYLGPPAKTLYSMPMYLEGGRWKVGLAVGSELPV